MFNQNIDSSLTLKHLVINIYIHLITNGKKTNKQTNMNLKETGTGNIGGFGRKEIKKYCIKIQYQKFKTLVISCSGRFALVF